MPAYISEVRYEGKSSTDFVEVAVETGTDLSGYSIYSYKKDGTIKDGPVSLGAVEATVAGTDVYVVTGADGLGNFKSADSIALVDDQGNVVQFVSFNGNTTTATEGPANGQTSTNIGTADKTESLQSDDGGASYYTQATPNAGNVPCYAPGTMIDTPDGPRPVEALQAGDLVLTLDHGPMPVRWVRRGDQSLDAVNKEAKPVLISAGSLGEGLPAQDLIVSPQHRILVGEHRQLEDLFGTEAFAPAKSLTSLPGIRHMKGKHQVTWVHFACDRHEIVVANDCLTKSLLLGPMVVDGFNAAERQSVSEIFGPASAPAVALNGPPARECLAVGEVRRHLARNPVAHVNRACQDKKFWRHCCAQGHAA